MGDKIRIGGAHKWAEMLHHPCILGGPQRHGGQNQNWCRPQLGGNATSPLHSWRSPKTSGTKSELVGPTSGRKCYTTPAFSGIPKDMGDKVRFDVAHKWAEVLHHPCILGDPQRHGGRSQNWWGPQVGGNATSPLHSRGSPKTWGTKSDLVGPTSGRKCYITPEFSGIPKDMGDKIRIAGAHKWAEMLHHPCILGGPQRHGGQNQNWWGPQVSGNATSPLHSRGSPKKWGTKSDLVSPTIGRKCYITLAFSGVPRDMGDKIRIGGAHKWAEVLHHPCILGGPQRDGESNQNWWGRQVGRKCYITPAFSGIPKDMGNKIRIGGAPNSVEMLHHPCILKHLQRHGEQNQNWWGPQVGGNATSPLHSRGSPKTWGTKSKLVGPTSGQKCSTTRALSGIPKRHGGQIQNWWGPQVGRNAPPPVHYRGSPRDMGGKFRIGGAHKLAEMLHHPCILGHAQRHGEQNQKLVGPTIGWKCYITPAFSGIPKDMGNKIRIGGAHKWVEMLHHPCILGDPQRHGGQKENCWGPQVGRNAPPPVHYRGSPRDMGDKFRIGGAHKWAEMLHHPCILRDPQRRGEQNQIWWGPQVGGNATSPLHSRGSPKKWGAKSELVGPTSGRKRYITPAFSGIPKDTGDKIRIARAHKWAEMLHHPCILGHPQKRGEQNQNWRGPQVVGNATSPLHSRGSPKTWGTKSDLVSPTIGRKCYITLAFSGIPEDMGDKFRIGGAHKWAEVLHHPCILGDPQRHGGQNLIWWGPQLGGRATTPLHSRGSPKRWGIKSELVGPTSGRKCYITPAFSGIPKDMGNKIRIGGAHKWVEMLHHPCILGDPHEHGGQNENCWGPQVGRNAPPPVHYRGSPRDMGDKFRIGGAHKWAEMLHHPCILGDPQRNGEQKQNWWGPQVGGNAASPLHSRGSPKTWGTKSELLGPTSGRKCYITPAFSGIPKDMGDIIRFGVAHKWAEMLHHPCILGDPQRHGGRNQNC